MGEKVDLVVHQVMKLVEEKVDETIRSYLKRSGHERELVLIDECQYLTHENALLKEVYDRARDLWKGEGDQIELRRALWMACAKFERETDEAPAAHLKLIVPEPEEQ